MAVVQREYRERMRRTANKLSICVSIDDIEVSDDVELNQMQEDLKKVVEGVIKRHVKGATPNAIATVREC